MRNKIFFLLRDNNSANKSLLFVSTETIQYLFLYWFSFATSSSTDNIIIMMMMIKLGNLIFNIYFMVEYANIKLISTYVHVPRDKQLKLYLTQVWAILWWFFYGRMGKVVFADDDYFIKIFHRNSHNMEIFTCYRKKAIFMSKEKQ